jgi:hypothetical protein
MAPKCEQSPPPFYQAHSYRGYLLQYKQIQTRGWKKWDTKETLRQKVQPLAGVGCQFAQETNSEAVDMGILVTDGFDES